MSKQHKALELADQLTFAGRFGNEDEIQAARRRLHRNQYAADELRRQHALLVQMREALRYLLAEVWSDRHSHMNEERFEAEFSNEKSALTAANEYLGEQS